MESYLTIFLTLTAVLVGSLSAPVPQNPQSKLRVAPCPQVKTGKYIVMVRDVVGVEGDQKTFLGYMKIMTKTDSDDTQVSKSPVTEKPTDADVSEEDKKPSVKSYQDLGFGMYSVDMNKPALKEVSLFLFVSLFWTHFHILLLHTQGILVNQPQFVFNQHG